MEDLRIAIIGQSNFAAEVLELLLEESFEVVGVFTIQDQGKREDVLATVARKHNIPVFKVKAWRKAGVALPDVLEQYKSVNATLNVLPYCSQFIPMEVIDGAKYGSVCYHPSILPRHRGASAISWTLIEGDDTAGFTIFWADHGLDTGPILLQRQTQVLPTDTLDILYKRFLYPEGVKYMVKAVQEISNGSAPRISQTDIGATYDPPMFKVENQKINLNQTAKQIWNFIRGLDSSPGALSFYNDENGVQHEIRFYNAHLYFGSQVSGRLLKLEGAKNPAVIYDGGMLLQGTDGRYVLVKSLKKDGRMIASRDFFNSPIETVSIELTEEDLYKKDILKSMWFSILKTSIDGDTDFFGAGAQSMDVVRLIEECNDTFGITMKNEQIFSSPTFREFFLEIIKTFRSGSSGHSGAVSFDGFVLEANKRKIPIPTQMFVNGCFRNAENDRVYEVINPTTNDVLCQVAYASVEDINAAVESADKAFHSTWTKVTPKQRGQLMYKLASLMEEHKEELATIEAVDSGAVYTLALKTHVGMSINVWKYFAGWTDKIEGKTIPIEPAVPNNVLTFTKREPIGVCGIIVPWNYPLMMLSWKMAACIAAGNTCIIKPAQVCPLTALKFAELSVKAGFPPGVINVVTGSGATVGQALADHPLVRKLGFTGSTEIGKNIMESCAQSNLKRCSLELGGKSPLVIFADCDLNKAVKQGASSVFFNKGENCIAAGRLFVEDTIHDEFVKRIVKDVESMVIGDPLNRSTTHGPQNNRAHLRKLQEFCDKGVEEGAKLMCGGKVVSNMKGLFFEPTVFTNVEDHMFIAKEESFGPIMIISKFSSSDIDSLLQRANSSEYGLASGVFTNDINKALHFANRIDCGTVFVNVYNKTDVAAPFGGFKQSGFGKDLGQEALNEYLRTKCVTIEYS